jgi:hypothetical protein
VWSIRSLHEVLGCRRCRRKCWKKTCSTTDPYQDNDQHERNLTVAPVKNDPYVVDTLWNAAPSPSSFGRSPTDSPPKYVGSSWQLPWKCKHFLKRKDWSDSSDWRFRASQVFYSLLIPLSNMCQTFVKSCYWNSIERPRSCHHLSSLLLWQIHQQPF